jgi:hypothetical protein
MASTGALSAGIDGRGRVGGIAAQLNLAAHRGGFFAAATGKSPPAAVGTENPRDPAPRRRQEVLNTGRVGLVSWGAGQGVNPSGAVAGHQNSDTGSLSDAGRDEPDPEGLTVWASQDEPFWRNGK